MDTTITNVQKEDPNHQDSPIDLLAKCEFLGTPDPDFRAFIDSMPAKHWSKYDLSAVRLGWEAYKALHT